MANEHVMQFFTYAHLQREDLRTVSQGYAELAQRTIELCPANPERTKALDLLLAAKDAAVRAVLAKPVEPVKFEPHAGSPSADVPDPKPTRPA